MSKQNFLMFIIPSPESEYLQENHPNAFLLLCTIARRARRYSGLPDGLEIGEAYIGDFLKSGIESERKYRTAKDILIKRGHIKICETCRNRKKSTTGKTTVGTIVKILKSDIWDINSEVTDDRLDDRPTTDRRPTDDERRTNKNDKKEEEYKKETNKEKSDEKIVRPSFKSSLLHNEDLEALLAYANVHELNLTEKDFSMWLVKYQKSTILENLIYLVKTKEKSSIVIEKHAAWLQKALDKDYAGSEKNVSINKAFCEEFKSKNDWKSLTITETYCRDEDNGNDYQFKLNPLMFKETLERTMLNKKGVC